MKYLLLRLLYDLGFHKTATEIAARGLERSANRFIARLEKLNRTISRATFELEGLGRILNRKRFVVICGENWRAAGWLPTTEIEEAFFDELW